jgi:hypothetical protein
MQNNDELILGKYYIEDDLEEDEVYNAKTDGHVKLNKSFNDDKNKKSTEENKEKENKEEIEDNLNESNSSDSSLDTKIYQLNGPLRNFLNKLRFCQQRFFSVDSQLTSQLTRISLYINSFRRLSTKSTEILTTIYEKIKKP